MEKPNFGKIVERLEGYSQNLKDNSQIGNSKLILAISEMIKVMGWLSSQQDTNNIQTANLTNEIKTLKDDLGKYSNSSNRESRRMLLLTIALGIVAFFQLFIAYGQYRLTPGATDPLKSDTITAAKTLDLSFERYATSELLIYKPAKLDTTSSRTANYFRTAINEQLEKSVNFASHYNIVRIGMTGWDTAYWIVDRLNGKAYPFPYRAWCINFQRNSSLLVINSKDRIPDREIDPATKHMNCETADETDLLNWGFGPAYFKWENDSLEFIGPKGTIPEINKFWTDFFDQYNTPDT